MPTLCHSSCHLCWKFSWDVCTAPAVVFVPRVEFNLHLTVFVTVPFGFLMWWALCSKHLKYMYKWLRSCGQFMENATPAFAWLGESVALYTGFFAPVFVACSTNAKECLVKTRHMQWRTWMLDMWRSGMFLLYSCEAAFWARKTSPWLPDVNHSVAIWSVLVVSGALRFFHTSTCYWALQGTEAAEVGHWGLGEGLM